MSTATKPKTSKRISKKDATKVTDVLVAWCIDRSGSMGGLVDSTIRGFNAFLAEQQEQPGKAYLSLVLFDDQFEAPIVATDIKEVQPLNRDTYYTRGMTALYDAVGVTIDGVEGWLANNPSFDGRVLIEIWTDGGENSSLRWRGPAGLNQMLDKVREKQAEGWTFSFLGSGGAAWTEGQHFAQTIGVANTTQTTHTASGVGMSYAAASESMSLLRCTGNYMGTNASILDLRTSSSSEKLAAFGIDSTAEALAGTDNQNE